MFTFGAKLIVFIVLLVAASCKKAPSVIIVGAGASGIAAATRLLENGIDNLTILEAEDRIGGRINSIKFGDAVVDLGAQWCHGEKNNVVYEMVKDLNLLESTKFSELSYFSSSDEEIDEEFLDELYALCEEIYEGEKPNEDVSMGEYITKRYNESIKEKYENNKETFKFAQEFLNTFRHDVLAMDGAFSWFDLSLRDDYEEYEGDQNLNWKGRGFKTILEVLMKNYPDSNNKLPVMEKIAFNKEVTQITVGGVTVKCADNSEYTADHIIVTVSLGVLKNSYNTLFRPSVPQEKINAINDLGIAGIAKVFLQYSSRWWPNNFQGAVLFWNEKDLIKLTGEFSEGPKKNDQSWLENFAEVFAVEGNPNLLVAWFSGEFVPEIELLSDDVLTKGITFILHKFLGHNFNVTTPDAILRSKWYTNPHFRGTYSFQTTDSYKRETPGVVALSKPLVLPDGKPALLFAGEATNLIHYGTVHGAIETGYREADRIINFYK